MDVKATRCPFSLVKFFIYFQCCRSCCRLLTKLVFADSNCQCWGNGGGGLSHPLASNRYISPVDLKSCDLASPCSWVWVWLPSTDVWPSSVVSVSYPGASVLFIAIGLAGNLTFSALLTWAEAKAAKSHGSSSLQWIPSRLTNPAVRPLPLPH